MTKKVQALVVMPLVSLVGMASCAWGIGTWTGGDLGITFACVGVGWLLWNQSFLQWRGDVLMDVTEKLFEGLVDLRKKTGFKVDRSVGTSGSDQDSGKK